MFILHFEKQRQNPQSCWTEWVQGWHAFSGKGPTADTVGFADHAARHSARAVPRPPQTPCKQVCLAVSKGFYLWTLTFEFSVTFMCHMTFFFWLLSTIQKCLNYAKTSRFGPSFLPLENVPPLPNSCYNPIHYCVFYGPVSSLDLCLFLLNEQGFWAFPLQPAPRRIIGACWMLSKWRL